MDKGDNIYIYIVFYVINIEFIKSLNFMRSR